jgi:hypothetical protein
VVSNKHDDASPESAEQPTFRQNETYHRLRENNLFTRIRENYTYKSGLHRLLGRMNYVSQEVENESQKSRGGYEIPKAFKESKNESRHR